MQVQAPNGVTLQVQIPQGSAPGTTFEIAMPAQWKVIGTEGIHVREAKRLDSTSLEIKACGALVMCYNEGAWLRLVEKDGYILNSPADIQVVASFQPVAVEVDVEQPAAMPQTNVVVTVAPNSQIVPMEMERGGDTGVKGFADL